MMKYSVLDKHEANGEGYEVRKYLPHKRTVSVCNRFYFIPIPYIVFMRYWDMHCTIFFNAIAKESDDVVYRACLPNINRNNGICLGGWGDVWKTHFKHSRNATMDDLVSRFWASDFDDFENWTESKYAMRGNYGYFRKWGNLSLEEAVKKVNYHPIMLNDFILQCIDGLETLMEYD